jgi:hypothetical protein
MSQTMVYNESTCSSCGGSHGTGRTGIVTNRDELRRLHAEHEGGNVDNSQGFQDRSRSMQEVGSHRPLGLPEPIDFSDHRLDTGVTNARATPPGLNRPCSAVLTIFSPINRGRTQRLTRRDNYAKTGQY